MPFEASMTTFILRLEAQEFEDVVAVAGPEVLLGQLSLDAGLPDAKRCGDALDVVQPAGRPDGLGLGAADFEAVVLDGVVRGGGLYAAQAVELVDGVIDHRGVDHADVDDVEAGGEECPGRGPGESLGELGRMSCPTTIVSSRRTLSAAAAGSGGCSFEVLAGGVADLPGVFLVEWIGVGRANVVGFEDFVDHVSLEFGLRQPGECIEAGAGQRQSGRGRKSVLPRDTGKLPGSGCF